MAEGRTYGPKTLPDWAKNFDPDSCMVLAAEGGGFVVVSNAVQLTVYYGKTVEDCYRWLREQGYQDPYPKEDYLPEDPEVAFLKEACGPGAQK